jgi:hypothetical protein
MSYLCIQLGLLSLASSALAAPVGISGVAFPTGRFFRNHGQHHGTGDASGTETMLALATNAPPGSTLDMVTVTMTADETVTMTGDDVPASTTVPSVDSTIFAESLAPTSTVVASTSVAAVPTAESSTAVVPVDASSNAQVQEARFSRTSSFIRSTTAAAAVPVSSAPAPASSAPAASVPAASVAKSSTPAATSTPKATATSAPAASGAKRGVAYNSASLVKPFIGQEQVSWAYNWAATSGGLASGIEYIPMLWTNTASDTSTWEADANAAIAAGATALLGFNEPDQVGQSNISPASAAASYKTYMSDMFGGKNVRLGSPAVTNGAAPMGLTYLGDFLSACTGCQVDFVVSFPYLRYPSIITNFFHRSFIGMTQQPTSITSSSKCLMRTPKPARTSGSLSSAPLAQTPRSIPSCKLLCHGSIHNLTLSATPTSWLAMACFSLAVL